MKPIKSGVLEQYETPLITDIFPVTITVGEDYTSGVDEDPEQEGN